MGWKKRQLLFVGDSGNPNFSFRSVTATHALDQSKIIMCKEGRRGKEREEEGRGRKKERKERKGGGQRRKRRKKESPNILLEH